MTKLSRRKAKLYIPFLKDIFGSTSREDAINRKSKLLDQFKKDAEQEKLQTEVKEISKEQQVIAAQIRASENASEETKTEIKKKLQKAAVEIQETLKKDNLAAIDEQIDEDWKGL